MKVPPPFKLALAAFFLDGPSHPRNALDALTQRYASAICNEHTVDFTLQSLKAVGILKPGDDGTYTLTENGRERVLKAL
jgi:hypothetical protein